MKTYRSSKNLLLRQILSAFIIGMGVVFILSLLFTLGILGFYHNRVLPGVTLDGTPLGGLTYDEAADVIAINFSYQQTGHILLQDGENSWMVSPAELGVSLNSFASAQNALSIGRSGSIFTRITDTLAAVFFGYAASPTFIFNENTAMAYLASLAAGIDQPMQNAGLKIENSEAVITQGQPGRVLDVASSLERISTQVRSMQDGVVELVVIEEQPQVLDVSEQSALVNEILSQPLELTLPDDQGNPVGPWTIEPADLAKMLTFIEEDNGGSKNVVVAINRPVLIAYLSTIESEINLDPQNARFTFDDDTRELVLYKSAVIGRSLDIENSVTSISTAVLNGEHTGELHLTLTQPQITDSTTAADLGITERVSQQITYFRGSSDERIQNIKAGAEKFQGILIAPGAEVSMSDILGDITLDNGFAEAPIIMDDQTIQGVGGGICQVSTTLFRTVLYAGFPILERHAHSYRVGYYEQTISGHDAHLAGMDATVFVPLVDFRFRNDTEYWLLMETWISTANYSLTWNFYSTSDGREVHISTPEITDVVEPEGPIYRENDELATGVIKQVEYEIDGAKVTFDRVVKRDGKVIYNDTFVTKYQPWQAVYEYGPGTDIPDSG